MSDTGYVFVQQAPNKTWHIRWFDGDRYSPKALCGRTVKADEAESELALKRGYYLCGQCHWSTQAKVIQDTPPLVCSGCGTEHEGGWYGRCTHYTAQPQEDE